MADKEKKSKKHSKDHYSAAHSRAQLHLLGEIIRRRRKRLKLDISPLDLLKRRH